MNDLARRQIRAAAQQHLRRAGIVGVVPTPLEVVSRVAGVTETLDIAALPDLVARKPAFLKRVLGAVLYRPRIIVIDRSQGYARGRFIEAHELSHKIIPWHEAIFRLDDEERLFGPTKRQVDAEADVGAAELLFQGDLFVRRALDFEVSIAAPIGLAPEFGVSLTAAIRHYAVDHPDLVAVIVAGIYTRSNGAVPVWAAHESPAFRKRFGAADALFPRGIPATPEGADAMGGVIHQALGDFDVVRGEVSVADLNGAAQPMVVEAICNGRVVLAMLSEKRTLLSGGRRVRVEAG